MKEAKKGKWLVVKCWANDNIECEMDKGNALEVMERQEHDWNDVALIPLEKVLDAIRSYQRTDKNPKDPTQKNDSAYEKKIIQLE